jgi:ornithine carbamoyltransferase
MTLRHLLEIDDLTADELTTILDLSEVTDLPRVLAGKGVALLFEKPSTRTRHSTEMAVVQLGGHPISARDAEVEIDKRESAEDVTRTLCCYHAAICARVFRQSVLERMARVSSVPVLNMLSDDAHPLQALADLLTLRQHFGKLDGLRIAWIGDYSNVARSLSLGASLLGASMAAASPPGYGPADTDLDRVRGLGGTIDTTDRPIEAIEGADCVVTDAWYSMGQEAEKEARRKAFEGFTVDAKLMAHARPDAIFMHCLPAHRGDEATNEVLDGPQSLIWTEAANRMHTARGALAFLLGVRP